MHTSGMADSITIVSFRSEYYIIITTIIIAVVRRRETCQNPISHVPNQKHGSTSYCFFFRLYYNNKNNNNNNYNDNAIGVVEISKRYKFHTHRETQLLITETRSSTVRQKRVKQRCIIWVHINTYACSDRLKAG
jgi:hypothetical protein